MRVGRYDRRGRDRYASGEIYMRMRGDARREKINSFFDGARRLWTMLDDDELGKISAKVDKLLKRNGPDNKYSQLCGEVPEVYYNAAYAFQLATSGGYPIDEAFYIAFRNDSTEFKIRGLRLMLKYLRGQCGWND